jgi:NAD(P)-dependent dehydrogenase (short-subunit alcohol dehydrogenase family)
MADKTILVTGASRGLGEAAARQVAKLGANVVLMARTENALLSVQDEIRRFGGDALAVPGDVTSLDDCRRAVDQALTRFGSLDGLINNAGALKPISPIVDADPQEWEINMKVNVLGPVFMTQLALRHLREVGGRVIHVSSGAAVKVTQGWAAYSVSKAALNHFNRLLAAEEPDITSLAFRPGTIDTAMQKTIRQEGADGMPEEQYQRFVRYHEEGELLPPEVPGMALAILALYAPHEWSGEFISIHEERVEELVKQHTPGDESALS